MSFATSRRRKDMIPKRLFVFAPLALLAGTAIAKAQQAADPRVSDLVRAGKVRVGMFPPQYVKGPTGELSGWAIDLSRALGARAGVEAIAVLYPGPDKLLAGLKAG